MQYRRLGRTGIEVSQLACGAGPIPETMTGGDPAKQRALIERAVQAGVNWFDTAAGYGDGRSEENLGRVLRELGVARSVHVATKVRLRASDLDDIPAAVEASCEASLGRLGLPRITLLQLHNSITAGREDEPTSITPDDVLGPAGVLEGFARLKSRGLVDYLGITGIGQAESLRQVVSSGGFDSVQVPYSLTNCTAGRRSPGGFTETNYGNIMADCSRLDVGVLAIRVFAGGALLGARPSRHTLQTKFFPLELYQRDLVRAQSLAQALQQFDERVTLKEAALRFAIAHPAVTTAIVGFSEPQQIDEAVKFADRGPLPADWIERLVAEACDAAGRGTQP